VMTAVVAATAHTNTAAMINRALAPISIPRKV